MRYRSKFICVLIGLALLSGTLGAMKITTGGDEKAKIVKRGQSPSGCPDTIAKTRSSLSGMWLALTPTEIRNAKPFVLGNAVQSNNSDERFFFTGVPLKVGPVQAAIVNSLKTGTTARTEVDIKIGVSRYRFVEWGAWEFALLTLGPSGNRVSIEISGSHSQSIPKEAYIASSESRDYDQGSMKVVQVGDFNGDGIVDLLLGYNAKEAEGLVLWLSDPMSKRHTEPITSPTAYFDCGSSS